MISRNPCLIKSLGTVVSWKAERLTINLTLFFRVDRSSKTMLVFSDQGSVDGDQWYV